MNKTSVNKRYHYTLRNTYCYNIYSIYNFINKKLLTSTIPFSLSQK